MSKSKSSRFEVLDGLRGFAMLLVFINHIESRYIVGAFPQNLQFLIQWLFVSGKNGIALFFLLSGFLMGHLYFPLSNGMHFIQRRYARIFPIFITMALAMWIFRLHPNIHLGYRIITIIGLGLFTRIVWIYLVERFKISKFLILFLILLQIISAIWYGVIIMRNPPIWFDSLPIIVRESTIFLTNITLTLPFGDYLPMLDGVYWSLIPEVLFYILFPLLIVPTMTMVQGQKKYISYIFIAFLFPFMFGVSNLFREIRGFQMMFIEYFIYFFAGITVAFIVKKNKPNISPRLKHFFNPIIFLLFLSFAAQAPITPDYRLHVILRIIWVIPFAFMVYFLLDNKSSLHTFLTYKPVVFLGSISFSLYVVHTSIVDGAKLLFSPSSPLNNLIFILLTFATSICVAYILHVLVEKLYFSFKDRDSYISSPNTFNVIGGAVTIVVIVLLFFIGYSSNYNFFSREYLFGFDNVTLSGQNNIKENKEIVLTSDPLEITFKSPDNMLGIATFHITHHSLPSKKQISLKKQKLLLQIKDVGNDQWYANQEVSTAEIGTSQSYPFGFPSILQSKNKEYTISLQLIDIDESTKVVIHTDQGIMNTVHQIDKKVVLTHPVELIKHMQTKIENIYLNENARITFIALAPLIFLYSILLLKR